MEQELERALEELTGQCRADYEANACDPYDSHIYAAKLEMLEELACRLEQLGAPELLRRLEEEQPGVERALEREAECPSFDWYNEHYHYLRLEGNLDARRAVRAALERACGG